MIFNRNKLFLKYPWLKKKNLPMIVSADYDGLICASFLHHHLNWKLEGYYDLSNIWISKNGLQNKNDLIWVDLNILPKQGKAIGGHIISIFKEIPKGFQSSCNPNIMAKIDATQFNRKFPFSTLIYFLWLYNIKLKSNLLSNLLILHSDSTWLKFQHYTSNCQIWQKSLSEYDWNLLFKNINTKKFEKNIDQELYPLLKSIGAISSKSKLKSKYLNIYSNQYQFNPDWDENVALQLFNLFGQYLKWTPPILPNIIERIEGHRQKVPLALIKNMGLSKFLKKNHVFSYAIPSPRIFNFTSFGNTQKSPLAKKYE